MWGNMRRSKRVLAMTAAGLLAAALSLSACTASAPEPAEAVQNVAAESWPTVEMVGSGSGENSLSVPEGAQSLQIEFACVGERFTLDAGAATSRSGGCQGTHSYLLPVPKQQGLLQLFVFVPGEGHFALTAAFSTEVSTPDPHITDACEKLSEYTSLYLNADQGYQRGEVSAEEWRTQIDLAVAIVTELQETATGLIGLEVPALVAGMSSAAVVPGYFHEPRSATEMDAAGTIVSAVCSDNGSELVISAAYGG